MLSKHLLLLPEGHTLLLRSSHSPSPPTQYTRHLLALLKSLTLFLPRDLGVCSTSEEQPRHISRAWWPPRIAGVFLACQEEWSKGARPRCLLQVQSRCP